MKAAPAGQQASLHNPLAPCVVHTGVGVSLTPRWNCTSTWTFVGGAELNFRCSWGVRIGSADGAGATSVRMRTAAAANATHVRECAEACDEMKVCGLMYVCAVLCVYVWKRCET